MAIAASLKRYLDQRSAAYETLAHPRTQSSMDTASVAHVPGDRLAKAVIVKDDESYVMVVVPSDYHVHLGRLHRHLGHEVGLATEEELVGLFPDCDRGAVPPLGAAYGLRTLVDGSLAGQPEVFFESGDHTHLVKVSGEQFVSLLGDAERVDVGKHM
jgi:Ala-tRNA(Pro) deacylase